MAPQIRPYRSMDEQPVVSLSLLAWAPVFVSLAKALGAEIFRRLHPDWQADQDKAVRSVLADPAVQVWVVAAATGLAGFVAAKLGRDSAVGEIYMLAVDPASQDQGIGTALTEMATDWLRASGMRVAMIDTGGDPGHAPARRVYDKAGYTPPSRRPVPQGAVATHAASGRARSRRCRKSPRSRIRDLTGLPVTELDQTFWSDDLRPTPRDRWEKVQRQLAAGTTWVLDGDLGPYDPLEPRLVNADTVVILDFGFVRCAWRATRRSRERADFWWWLVTWRWRCRPRVLKAGVSSSAQRYLPYTAAAAWNRTGQRPTVGRRVGAAGRCRGGPLIAARTTLNHDVT